MHKAFNENYWRKQLNKPDWYIKLAVEIEEILCSDSSDKRISEFKNKAYALIVEMLKKNEINLALSGPNFDKDRMPIDTIVIHHTVKPVKVVNMLSAMGLIRQYAMDYLHKKTFGHDLYGKAIWSNHFRDNKQVFYAYHWLISEDGKATRLLDDSSIAKHAGNWGINRRSIGIALSGNFEVDKPRKAQLACLSKLIEAYYPKVGKNWILYHSEVADTLCPGKRLREVFKISQKLK